MTPPTKRSLLSTPARYSLFIILSLLFVSSHAAAIDLGRAFKKNKDDSPSAATTNDDATKAATSGDALAEARKLIDNLNDAAMGTVVQPGREKEPATCDEILAKSLVVAKEEKAAVAAEKDAVVRAAALLSEKIDDLNALLESAKGEIAVLEDTLASQVADHEAKLEEVMADAERVKQEAEDTISAEMEKFKVEMDVLKNATSTTIAKHENENAEIIARMERDVAERIAEAEQQVTTTEEYYKDLLAKAEEGANGKVASIIAKSEQEMAAVMKNTAKKIAEAELDAQKKIDRMELDITDLHAAHKQEISNINASHDNEMKDMKEVMELKVQRIHDEMDKAIAKAEKKISAEREKNEKLQDQLQQMKTEAANAQKSLLSDLEMTRISSIELEKVSKDMFLYFCIDGHDLNSTRFSSNDVFPQFSQTSNIMLVQEVSFWKETHAHQGYCNTTLLLEDSRRLVMNALDSTSRGLDGGHKMLMAGLATQLELAQRAGTDVKLYFENDLLPAIEKLVREAMDTAVAMYDNHLAAPVNNNLLPFYNERIYPVYNERIYPVYNENILPVYMEHVSPAVKTIESEMAVAIQKSQEGVQLAREKSATIVEETSAAVLELIKEDTNRVVDKNMLLQWLYQILDHASRDGNWAVEKLFRGLLVIVAILCRSLIFRIIGYVLSWIWFFCPLRLFARARPKEGTKNDSNGVKSRTNGRG